MKRWSWLWCVQAMAYVRAISRPRGTLWVLNQSRYWLHQYNWEMRATLLLARILPWPHLIYLVDTMSTGAVPRTSRTALKCSGQEGRNGPYSKQSPEAKRNKAVVLFRCQRPDNGIDGQLGQTKREKKQQVLDKTQLDTRHQRMQGNNLN